MHSVRYFPLKGTLRTTKKQLQQAAREGLEPGTSGLHLRHLLHYSDVHYTHLANQLSMLPPDHPTNSKGINDITKSCKTN